MHDMILLDPAKLVVALIEATGAASYFLLKGAVAALLSELIFRPLARKLKLKGEEWEQTHPKLLRWIRHFTEGHTGNRPSQCLEGLCPEIQ